MYLLDTNYCSYLIRKQSTLYNQALAIGTSHLATCVIVQGELIYMAKKSKQKQQNLIQVENFLRYLRVYFVTETTAEIYGSLKNKIIQKFAPKEKKR